MKILKMMAVAALFMPLLFSCSGGSSSKNNLLGAIPDQYAQFVEEKAQIKKEAENIKTAEDKKALIEKSEKMTAKWKEKMEESAKALSGKPIEIAECNFNVTEPMSLEFDDFFSKSDLKPKFNIKGTAIAKADTQTELNYVLKSIPVYLVGYDAEGKEVFKTKTGYVDVEDVNGKAFIKANTPVKFDPVRFGESDIEGSKTAKTYKLEVKE